MKGYQKFLLTWAAYTIAMFLLYDVIWYAVTANVTPMHSITELWTDVFYCSFFSVMSIMAGNMAIHAKWMGRGKYKRVLVTTLILFAANLMLAFFIQMVFGKVVEPAFDGHRGHEAYILALLSSLLSLIFITEQELELQLQQKEDNDKMQKKMLKMQLNPHFIFNNLNFLAGLIEENAERAEAFTIRLARIYRYVMDSLNKETILLSNAIAFAEDYGALLRHRTPYLSVQIDDFHIASDEAILPLGIQLLIENAIKHNAADEDHPLFITIKREEDCLVVKNNLTNLPNSHKTRMKPSGIGLENLQQRYLLQANRPIQIIQRDGFFEVHIPIIKHKQ